LRPYQEEKDHEPCVMFGVRHSGKIRNFCIPGKESQWDPFPTTQCCSCARNQLTNENAYTCIEFKINPGNKISYTAHTYRFPGHWTFRINHYLFEHVCKSCLNKFVQQIEQSDKFSLKPKE